jgi:hypothetical protein
MDLVYENQASTIPMKRILESAVQLSWKELAHTSSENLVQIEYVPGAVLQYLKIWQLVGKGAWSLVCEYWMHAGAFGAEASGLTFSNGYQCQGLGEMLGSIMQHQDSFPAPPETAPTARILVSPPTPEERIAAEACMSAAYAGFGLSWHLPVPAVA